MNETYPMSEYDGLDQEYQLLLEENKQQAKTIEILELALKSRYGLDAEMVVRHNLCMAIYEAMCGANEDLGHARALAFAVPATVQKELEADFPNEDWMKLWEADYEFVHGNLTWGRVMEILYGFPAPLPPGQKQL